MLKNAYQKANRVFFQYPAIGFFFVLALLTRPFYFADSADYAHTIIDQEAGKASSLFWESSHLLWRPIGLAIHQALRPFFVLFFPQGEFAQVSASLMFLSFILTIVGIIYLYRLLRLFRLSERTVHLTVLLYVVSQCVLNYGTTGTSYMAGLSIFMAGLYYTLHLHPEPGFKNMITGGILLSIAPCLWLPYILALPAAFLARPILYGFNRSERLSVMRLSITFALALIVIVLPITILLHLHSPSAILSWSFHAEQSHPQGGIQRTILGLVKTLFYLGQDGVYIKRYLYHDSYHPVSLVTLLMLGVWKIALFYLIIVIVIASLIWRNNNRRYLLFLLLGILPTLILSTRWDGAALERHMPLLPFFFFAFALWLEFGTKYDRILFALLLLATLFINVNAMWFTKAIANESREGRTIDELWPNLNDQSLIVVLSIGDEIVQFQRIHPFSRFNQGHALNTYPLLWNGTDSARNWKSLFKAAAEQRLNDGGTVWVSKSLLEPSPPEWESWVENSSIGLSWKAISEYFRTLPYTDSTEHFLGLHGRQFTSFGS